MQVDFGPHLCPAWAEVGTEPIFLVILAQRTGQGYFTSCRLSAAREPLRCHEDIVIGQVRARGGLDRQTTAEGVGGRARLMAGPKPAPGPRVGQGVRVSDGSAQSLQYLLHCKGALERRGGALSLRQEYTPAHGPGIQPHLLAQGSLAKEPGERREAALATVRDTFASP